MSDATTLEFRPRAGRGAVRILIGCGLMVMPMTPAEAALKVVTTSKPVHALVASVMGDTGTPTVLVEGILEVYEIRFRSSRPRDRRCARS